MWQITSTQQQLSNQWNWMKHVYRIERALESSATGSATDESNLIGSERVNNDESDLIGSSTRHEHIRHLASTGTAWGVQVHGMCIGVAIVA